MIGRPFSRSRLSLFTLSCLILAGILGCAAGSTKGPNVTDTGNHRGPLLAQASPRGEPGTARSPQPSRINPIMLGIDVLEADGFQALRGKRVGLLTHPAGVNRRGQSTVDVLFEAPQVNLVALFGPEHGIYGNEKAEIYVANRTDDRTGLPVYSLYNENRRPTSDMLKGIDTLVIDLQDIGTRSYTYVSSMLYSMASCFESNVEVVVLDRPNPLGGLKVDGPPLDAQWKSYVGAFRAPYVHGLTIGEIARLARYAPGVLRIPRVFDISDEIRERGKLTVISMRGWNRAMRWPETGLKWVPTSPAIPDFASAVGYPMTGLGTYLGGFSHGIGKDYLFRGISHPKIPNLKLEQELRALNLPGLDYRRVNVTGINGKPAWGLYLEITDWAAWNPTELNFHLMHLACRYDGENPFAEAANSGKGRGFIVHTGSEAFFDALARDGAKVDIRAWFAKWKEQALVYQQQTRRYWLY